MEQQTIENFKVIGRCSKMQTLSLDQEVSLCDGIPYDIDFSQDFSRMFAHGSLLTNVSVANLIEAIDCLTGKTVSPSAGRFPQKENDQYDKESFRNALELATKEVKEEIKYEKKRDKIPPEVAWRNYKRCVKKILGGKNEYR